MPFTNPKCAVCMAEWVDVIDPYKKNAKGDCWVWGQRECGKCNGHCNHEVVITKINKETKTITVERVKKGKEMFPHPLTFPHLREK